MRIAIVNLFYVPDLSPTAHLAASLAEHRAAAGDEVTIVTGRGSYVPVAGGEARAGADNPRVVRLWTTGLGKRRLIHRLTDYVAFFVSASWTLFRLPRQDVVIAMTTPPYIAWAGLLHKWRHPGARLVLWNMDCYPEIAESAGAIREGGVLSRALRALNRALFRRLDHVVCLDTAMAELLDRSYAPEGGLPSTVVPNWEPVGLYADDPQAQGDAVRAELGLGDRCVVLYLGNAGHGHDFTTVLAAAEALRDEPVTFLFVGGGAQWSSLSAAVRERRLTNVILRPYVPKERTPAVLAAADCALITLRDSALGVVCPSKLHANLAMRLPVLYVGPRGSNVDEAVVRYDCGASLRHGDAAGVVEFVRSLLRTPGFAAELGARARLAFEERYCCRSALPRFDDVLAEVAAPRSATRGSRAHRIRAGEPVDRHA